MLKDIEEQREEKEAMLIRHAIVACFLAWVFTSEIF